MKKIRSYTSIWSVEKVIYAINDLQLPFPITFTQMTWFIVSLFVVILFGSLPPLSLID
ncbi:TPA: conjugal transfer protein, partial [Staphylococcus aureus]|nr:conjugal transfer protein [Staphylococcus aureus]